MKVVDVHGLTKRYGSKTVVDQVSISIEQGEISGFLGPNGSGKTTTLRMMCGLLTPDSGHGTILGLDLGTSTAEIKRQVGYMTQRFSFYQDLTIEENLDFVARLYQLEPRARQVEDTLERLGLKARRSQLAGKLSGGWKQRLALAACIMHRPRLLLLDEPTAGVDPKARREFWNQIHEIAADGITVLVSTHYMDEAERCHRINYISHGRLLTGGTVADVIDNAHLITMLLEGPDAEVAIDRLGGQPGVDQIAPFGSAFRVVGRDRAALQAALDKATAGLNLKISDDDTSLEDVFVHLMSTSAEGAA